MNTKYLGSFNLQYPISRCEVQLTLSNNLIYYKIKIYNYKVMNAYLKKKNQKMVRVKYTLNQLY